MNCGHYIGRMSKDFAPSSTSNKVGFGTIAVDRPYPYGKDAEGKQITDFLTIKVIGEKPVERAVEYLKKGVKIALTGVTCKDTSKDEAGNWKEFNYIIVDKWEFCESKGSSSSNDVIGGAQPQPQTDADGFAPISGINESELPFLV